MSIKKLFAKLNLSQIIALGFLAIIIIGTTLLALPVASKSGESVGFLTALFTTVSSVCVTGLSVVDVWSTFTMFGQIVLLFLIETGGLGFMSIISIMFYMSKHKNNIQSLSLMAEAIGSDDIKDITRIQKKLLIGSLGFEGLGAIILFFEFLPTYGTAKSVWYGIFHSVSSFCNAGFDLLGITSPGSSLESVNNNPVILITLAILVIIGGIGFVVWDDITVSKHPRNWSVNTRLVLIMTGALLVIGTVGFFAMEYNNPDSIGNMSLGNKIANAFFQSSTTRTAGFAAIAQNKFSGGSIALTTVLMAIGGSAGSTAGGIKTVTILILLKTIIDNIRGKKNVTLMSRTISEKQTSYAVTVVGSFVLLSIIGAFIINLTSPIPFSECFYESVSALATVGLSLGVTSSVSIIGKIVLIVFMYIGRVGLLTLTLGFFRDKENTNIKYPSVKIML